MSPASRLIDRRIRDLGGWRAETLTRVRALIRRADPEVTEEWKWDVPVWAHHGILCTGEVYAKVVKLTFAHGASLPDPSRLFNSSLGGNTRRAMDLREGDKLDARAFQALIRAAVARNAAPRGKADASSKKPAARRAAAKQPVVLLSGGNPQIAKGYGDAPVRAYLAAMPGWKRTVGRRLDALITRAVPGVRKAVKYNSPLYGAEEGTWFLGVHCFDKYIKLAFFRGASLRPLPPVGSRTRHARYLHVFEGEPFDEARFVAWVKQASKLPGERM